MSVSAAAVMKLDPAPSLIPEHVGRRHGRASHTDLNGRAQGS